MRNTRFLVILSVFSLFFLLGINNKVLAQSATTGLSVSPLTFELTANRGDVLTNKLRIYNPTDATIAIRMEIEDFKAVGETGQVIVVPDEEATYSLKRWVRTEPAEFTLEPKEQKFIDFTISVPDNAEPGGKYGTILASTAGMISADKISGAAVAQKVGALILLTVSGDVRENLDVKEFSAPDFMEYGPVTFNIRFENEGSVHVRPKGFVTIADWRGAKAADIEFPQMNVIPGTTRKIEAKWDAKWMIGKYTATLVGSYGTSNTPIEPYIITFWVFPWKMILAILIVLLIFFIFFYKTKRRWKMAMKALIKGNV